MPETIGQSLEAQIASLPWWHSIDFGKGVVSPGMAPLDGLRYQADVYFAHGVDALSVIDVGCWDGFNSFEAKRRGARRVLATDHFAWSDECWGSREAFDLAREHVAPAVEVLDIDLHELSVEAVGMFDVVLFLGVLYHLKDPFGVIERVSSLAGRRIVVETHLDALDVDRPAMILYPNSELNGDPTNWWGPNPASVISMLRTVGFQQVEYTPNPVYPGRGIFHGHR